MAYLDQILAHAMSSRASDVHFSAGEPIRMRIDGDLLPMEGAPMSSEQLEQVFSEILTQEEREKLEKQLEEQEMKRPPNRPTIRR